MASFNQVNILGNVTRDPESKFLPSGTAVTEIGLAINENYKNAQGEKTESVVFVDVVFFGKVAEIASKYLSKGKPAFVSGRLKTESWDDKQTGQKRSKMRVVGENLQLLGGKDDQPTSQPASRPTTWQAAPPARTPAKPADPALEPDDDSSEIPF